MAYYLVTTLIFWILFLIWTKKDLFNFLLKIMLLGMAVWSTFNLMEISGYIIKVGGV